MNANEIELNAVKEIVKIVNLEGALAITINRLYKICSKHGAYNIQSVKDKTSNHLSALYNDEYSASYIKSL